MRLRVMRQRVHALVMRRLQEMGYEMRREWIVDVLADLKAFAEHNGLDATAAGLEDAALVAVAEIASFGARNGAGEVERIVPAHALEASNVTELFSWRGRA